MSYVPDAPSFKSSFVHELDLSRCSVCSFRIDDLSELSVVRAEPATGRTGGPVCRGCRAVNDYALAELEFLRTLAMNAAAATRVWSADELWNLGERAVECVAVLSPVIVGERFIERCEAYWRSFMPDLDDEFEDVFEGHESV